MSTACSWAEERWAGLQFPGLGSEAERERDRQTERRRREEGERSCWGVCRWILSSWRWEPACWCRSSPGETCQVISRGSWQEGDKIAEGWHLPSSSAFKAYYKRKGFVSFIWRLNDLSWGRDTQIIFTTTFINSVTQLLAQPVNRDNCGCGNHFQNK